METITPVRFFALLAEAGLRANAAATIDADGTEWWALPGGRLLARQIGSFGCTSTYYLGAEA